MGKRSKILFITPFFNHGGSEIYLYELLNCLDKKKFEFSVLSNYPGEFTKHKTLDYPVYVNQTQNSSNKYRLNKICKRIFYIDLEFLQFKKIIKKQNPDIIYINTAILAKYALYARKLGVSYIVHFHEQPSVYDNIPSVEFEQMIVKNEVNKIRNKNVFVQYEHIRLNKFLTPNKKDLRVKLHIPENSFVWIMSGMKSYRKGYDLVPDICKAIEKNNGYLLWVGWDRLMGINSLVKRSNIKNFIESGHLSQIEYNQIFEIAQGFVLTSREDPFPLVMIEAASHGLPIFSFNSGGVIEFVQEGMGKVVPNCDMDSLTTEMLNFMIDSSAYDRNISMLKAKEFDVVTKTLEWEHLIEQIL